MKSRLIYLLQCREGKHRFKEGHSRGYGDMSEGSKTCRICGQYEEWGLWKNNYKSTVKRSGDFRELKELGIDA